MVRKKQRDQLYIYISYIPHFSCAPIAIQISQSALTKGWRYSRQGIPSECTLSAECLESYDRLVSGRRHGRQCIFAL